MSVRTTAAVLLIAALPLATAASSSAAPAKAAKPTVKLAAIKRDCHLLYGGTSEKFSAKLTATHLKKGGSYSLEGSVTNKTYSRGGSFLYSFTAHGATLNARRSILGQWELTPPPLNKAFKMVLYLEATSAHKHKTVASVKATLPKC